VTTEEARTGGCGMEFTQTGGLPMPMAASGCICSYTWANGKAVRNGAMESCQAVHADDVTVSVDGGDPVPGEWGQVRYMPGIEDRIAALEAALLPRDPEWTDEQVAEFRAKWDERMAAGDWEHRKYEPVRVLPQAPLLTPETARALLSECVTVVKPGETLVIRVPESWTPQQAEQYQEYADAATGSARISFPVLVVIGEELAVVQPEPDDAFAKRVEKVLPGLIEKEVRTARFKR
jgi:hypothetical protein